MRLSHSLSKLELFVKTAELGSLSKAAHALGLTPSAVSKGLSQFEDQLGTTLIKRTTRTLSLTESGAMMYQRAAGILQDADSALNEAMQFRTPSGLLRVSCSIAFGCTQVSRMLRDFMSAYPEIEVALTLDDRLVELSSEDCDVVLRITAREDWDYPGRKLTQISWVYAAGPGYIRSHPPIRTPDDIVGHACLLYPAMTARREWGFVRNGEFQSVTVPCRAISNSSLALAEMAVDNCGIVCIPRYVAQKPLSEGQLEIVLPDYEPEIQHVLYAMYFKTRYSNPAVRVLIEFLTETFRNGAPWEKR